MEVPKRSRRRGLLMLVIATGLAGCTQSEEIPLAKVPQVKLSGEGSSTGKAPPRGQRSPDSLEGHVYK